jgi:hypothetical protein
VRQRGKRRVHRAQQAFRQTPATHNSHTELLALSSTRHNVKNCVLAENRLGSAAASFTMGTEMTETLQLTTPFHTAGVTNKDLARTHYLGGRQIGLYTGPRFDATSTNKVSATIGRARVGTAGPLSAPKQAPRRPQPMPAHAYSNCASDHWRMCPRSVFSARTAVSVYQPTRPDFRRA